MDQDVVPEHPPPEGKGENIKCFYLFNCDTTYKLDAVENLLSAINEKVNFNIKISEKKYFRLFEMAELCETVLSGPPMDVAIFVVHAHESRLSINEDNAGIGYAKFYRALLQAAGERVIVIIGGDDNYRGAAEEEKAVLSRWAKRQISSQFKEEFIDGQKSFIFSWDKKHRAIHEEALLHFLDPAKKGTKFVYEPKQPQTTPSADTNQLAPVPQVATSKESSGVDVKTNLPINYSNAQPVAAVENQSNNSQPAETESEQERPFGDHPTDREKPKTEETLHAIPESASGKYPVSEPEFACIKEPKTIVNDTSSQEEKPVVILCRDQSDTIIIKNVFGDERLSKVHIFKTRGSLDAWPESLLSHHSVRSCFIVVDAGTMEEELHRKSVETPYENLLVAAREAVEKKVVVIVCSDKGKTSPNEEDTIKERIKQILGVKGIVLWWKDNEHSKTIANDISSQEEKPVAILCRDQSETIIIKEVFGVELLSKVHIFSGPPDAFRTSLLSNHLVRSCFIFVDARTMEEKSHRVSVETPYESLLVAAREAVEQKVVVIACSDKGKTSQNGEDNITERIKQILGEKGVVLWWKVNEHSLVETKSRKRALQLNRSKSLPDDGVAKKSVVTKPRPINPEEFTLLLKTRLHLGKISYQEGDVQERLQGWTAPDYMADDLMMKWHSTSDAELKIYREPNTSNLHAVVNPAEKKFRDNVKGAFQRAGDYLSSELENIGTSISGVMSEDFLSLD